MTVALPTVTETSPTVGGIVTLPQFDSSFGTLTGVELDFGPAYISANTEIADFEEGGNINITYSLGYQVTFTLPYGGPFVVEDAQDLNCSGLALSSLRATARRVSPTRPSTPPTISPATRPRSSPAPYR